MAKKKMGNKCNSYKVEKILEKMGKLDYNKSTDMIPGMFDTPIFLNLHVRLRDSYIAGMMSGLL